MFDEILQSIPPERREGVRAFLAGNASPEIIRYLNESEEAQAVLEAYLDQTGGAELRRVFEAMRSREAQKEDKDVFASKRGA